MHSDEIAQRPDLLQGQLLNTEGGRDLRRNDGIIPYSLVVGGEGILLLIISIGTANNGEHY